MAGGEDPGHGVVKIVVRAEVPDVRDTRTRLVHAQEHVDGHLLVSI